MSDQTKGGIAWTDHTWNPVRGCSRVSEGCRYCYAEGVAARFSGLHPETGKPLAYHGLARRSAKGLPQWTGEVRLVQEHLGDPLRWTRPRMIFVNSMSDLFHEGLQRKVIAACFGVMAVACNHTYQVLTKRAKRMREIMSSLTLEECFDALFELAPEIGPITGAKSKRIADQMRAAGIDPLDPALEKFPLPWIHLGVSVENQETADERIPELLATPASVRWVSAEPMLGAIDFDAIQIPGERDGLRFSALTHQHDARYGTSDNLLDWIVVGGESGEHARAFDLPWARSIRDQCKAANVAFFMKQMGSFATTPNPNVDFIVTGIRDTDGSPAWSDRKGGKMEEWPPDLRVREWPRCP